MKCEITFGSRDLHLSLWWSPLICVCSVSLCKCAAARSRVCLCIWVTGPWELYWVVKLTLALQTLEPLFTQPQPPPYTHTWLHAGSRQHALTHTLMHRRTLSRTQNVSLGIPVGPGGREEADGGQWAGHLSCVAALRPLTMERGDRRVVPFFPLSPFRGDFCISQWSFCPLTAIFPVFNPLNLLLSASLFFCSEKKSKRKLN